MELTLKILQTSPATWPEQQCKQARDKLRHMPSQVHLDSEVICLQTTQRFSGKGRSNQPHPGFCSSNTWVSSTNKYERYYWTRKAPACLLTLLCHYGKPCLCINIHHYAPPIGCSVTHWAATSLPTAGLCGVNEGSKTSFKSITWNKLC